MNTKETNAKKLSVALGLLRNETCGTSKYIFITEIDGITNLDVRINIKNQNLINLEIKAEFKSVEGDCCCDYENPLLYRDFTFNSSKLTQEDFLEFSTKILNNIPLLKLQPCGNLEIPDNKLKTINNTFDDVFSSIACSNVCFQGMKECSVCYEKTYSTTSCKHSLCNRCWSKISKIDDDDEDEITPCPICRQDIRYVKL